MAVKSWNMYNSTVKNTGSRYVNMLKVPSGGKEYFGYSGATGGYFLTSIRSRGYRDLIEALDAFDSNNGSTTALYDALEQWTGDLIKELEKYPNDYDGTWINRLRPGHASEYWNAEYGLGSTGVSASIWNEQLSEKGFNYVKYINDHSVNAFGSHFKTPTGFIDRTLYDNDAEQANRAYLLPAIVKIMRSYGIPIGGGYVNSGGKITSKPRSKTSWNTYSKRNIV